MRNEPLVDVGVVTWNTAELTARALRTLLDSDQGCSTRVLVHDNASEDETVARLAEHVPEAEVVAGSENLGFARAVNLLLARSDAPWFLALNSDAWPEPGALRTLVDHATDHPRAAAVAPLLLRPDGSVEHSTHPFPSPRLALLDATGGRRWMARRYLDRHCLEGAWHHDRARVVDWAVGAALLLRRRAVDDIGGLDERFFMYAEDMEWCWRARRRGWEVHFQPDAVVRHVGNASGQRRFGDRRSAVDVANARQVLREARGPVSAATHRALTTVAAGERLLLARARPRTGRRRLLALAGPGLCRAARTGAGRSRAASTGQAGAVGPRPEPAGVSPTWHRAQPKVSVVVATRGRAALLPRLVTALADQTLAPDEFELVAVNDASPDQSRDVLDTLAASAPFAMRAIHLTRHEGAAAARNHGWRAARAPVVAFTDDDCVPAVDWLASGSEAIAGRAVVVLGRTDPPPHQQALATRPFSRKIEVHGARFFETCNAFYRRGDLEAAGGFDEHLRVAGEDTDLGLRARAQGVTPLYSPEVVVHHDVQPGTLVDAMRNTLRFTDIAMVVRRHPDARRTLLHRRVFWKDTHPTAIVAGVGLALSLRRPWALGLLAPWAYHRIRTTPACPGPLRHVAVLPAVLALDLFEVATMVRSSVRHRTILL